MATGYVSWRHTGCSWNEHLSNCGLKSVALWGSKETDKKYFLIHITQIRYGAHPVSYSNAVLTQRVKWLEREAI